MLVVVVEVTGGLLCNCVAPCAFQELLFNSANSLVLCDYVQYDPIITIILNCAKQYHQIITTVAHKAHAGLPTVTNHNNILLWLFRPRSWETELDSSTPRRQIINQSHSVLFSHNKGETAGSSTTCLTSQASDLFAFVFKHLLPSADRVALDRLFYTKTDLLV